MAPEAETVTFRCDSDFKAELNRAAKAENQDMSGFVMQAVKLRMNAACSHCGRSDRPVGAGLSQPFEDFLEKVQRDRDMMPVCISASLGNKLVAYRARINLLERSQGQLLMMLDFKQGQDSHTAEFAVPRGLVTGWQQDNGAHQQQLVNMGHINGNDAVIRGYLAHRRLRVVTVRVVLDAICSMPGITEQELREHLGLPRAENALPVLQQRGLVGRDVGGGWSPMVTDADVAMQTARDRGIDLDEFMG